MGWSIATLSLGTASLLVTWGCATTPGAKPDDMSAEQHREAAQQHDVEAAEHASEYDPEAREEGPQPYIDEYGYFTTMAYNPTAEHLRHAKRHRRHAADHAAAAEELEAFENKQCGRFPPEVRRTCPLLGKVASVEDIEQRSSGGPARSSGRRGVRIHFAPDVNVDAVIAHMRCHLAYAQTMGREGMDHCPLYIEGVEIDEDGAPPAEGIHGVKGHSPTSGQSAAPGTATTEGSWRSAHKLRVERGDEAGSVNLLIDDDKLLRQLRKRVQTHVPKGD